MSPAVYSLFPTQASRVVLMPGSRLVYRFGPLPDRLRSGTKLLQRRGPDSDGATGEFRGGACECKKILA